MLAVAASDVPTLEAWASALGARLASLGTVTAGPEWILRTPGSPAAVTLEPAPLKRAWAAALDDAFVLSPLALA